jgi:hypothetical protein
MFFARFLCIFFWKEKDDLKKTRYKPQPYTASYLITDRYTPTLSSTSFGRYAHLFYVHVCCFVIIELVLIWNSTVKIE